VDSTIIDNVVTPVALGMIAIGVGGVSSAEDAWLHIRAGASLVELYTALIYEGPGVAERIKTELADLLRRGGFRSIGEAVGIDR